jgi:hypothetical protein
MNTPKTIEKSNLKKLAIVKKYDVLTDAELRFEEGQKDEMYGDEQFKREIEQKDSLY